MDSHGRWICAFDPSDGLSRGIWARLEVLLVGIFRNSVQILKVQRVLMSRKEMRAFVIQDTLRDPTKHAICVWGERGKGSGLEQWQLQRNLYLNHLQTCPALMLTFSKAHLWCVQMWQTEQVFQERDEDQIQMAFRLDKSCCRLYRCAQHVPHGLMRKTN